jgi:hypothetical protein
MRGGAPVEGACSTVKFNGAELDEQDALIRYRFSLFTKKSRFLNDPQIKAKPTPYIGYATIKKISQRCLLHVNGEPLFLSERLFGRTVSEANVRVRDSRASVRGSRFTSNPPTGSSCRK